jgi:hypothetical protein
MVFPELTSRIALILETGRDSYNVLMHPDRRARHTDFGKTSAIHTLPGDEGRASRSAGLFTVRIGEHHAFLGDAVDIGRSIAHEPVRIATQVRDADVVAPNDEDVRLVRFGHVNFLSFCSRVLTDTPQTAKAKRSSEA